MKLIVSEKNNTAKRIATILSGGKYKAEELFKTPVYIFKDEHGTEVKCVGLKGHILKVDYPEEYNNWQEVEPMALIDVEVIKLPVQKNIIKALQKLAKEAQEVIISTDFDREGEVIGVDAVNKIKEVNPKIKVKRARFSALTKAEIEKAFSHLEEIYLDLAFAGEARQDIDLIWGATLTRFLSLASSRLGRQFLSAGRVQSPTLALVAEREKQRQVFIPEPFWQIKAIFEHDSQTFEARHKTERFWKKEDADKVVAKLESAMKKQGGVVESITRNERTVPPPAPFNTTAFLSAASSLLKLSASNSMRIAEGLYMNGLISYPRVDNTVYPDSMDFKEILHAIGKGEFAGLASEILEQGKIVPTKGKRFATDHPPIHPTEAAEKSQLEPREWKVYELVLRRFLATLAPEGLTEGMRVDIDVKGEPFFVRGNRVLKEGWLKFYPYARKKDVELPNVEDGDKLRLVEYKLEEKETQPPARYGQGELIRVMEELGLGTKATRHSIIQSLYERGYVHSDPLIPTETGLAVAESLLKHAEAISTPKMTAELEGNMNAIAEGKVKCNEVVDKSRSMLKSVMTVLEKEKQQVAEEIRVGIRGDKIIGKCSDCGQELKIIRSKRTKKRFVGCTGYPDCSRSYPLPQRGEIIALDEVCDTCGSPKIRIVFRGSRPWTLCIDPSCPTKKANNQKTEEESQKQEEN